MNKSIIVRMIDSFMYFLYQSSQKLKKHSYFGMILPDVILYQKDNYKLREYLLKKYSLKFIANLGNNVFEGEGITRPSCILIFSLRKKRKDTVFVINLADIKNKQFYLNNINYWKKVIQEFYDNIPNKMFITNKIDHYEIYNKILNRISYNILKDFVDSDGIQRGVSPDLKEAFIVDRNIINTFKLERAYLKPVITGGTQVKRYFIDFKEQYLIYTRKNDNFKSIPNICRYIDQYSNKITCKEVKQKKHPIYSLHRPRKENIFLKPNKLIGVITEDELIVSIDNTGLFATDGCYLFGAIESKYTKYLLSILNSKLFKFLYRLIAIEEGRPLAQVKPSLIEELPIRIIDFSNQEERKLNDNLNSLVDLMLDLNKKIQTAKGSEKEQIQKQIEKTDKEIDDIVYKLYGITDEERKIIEET